MLKDWVIDSYTDTRIHKKQGKWGTRRGAVRDFAGTAIFGGIVAACVHHPAYRACRCPNVKNLAVGVIDRT
jgi:hypothetical protein